MDDDGPVGKGTAEDATVDFTRRVVTEVVIGAWARVWQPVRATVSISGLSLVCPLTRDTIKTCT